MTDHIDQAAGLFVRVHSLMHLVAELRSHRDHDQMFSPTRVSFAEVVDKAAGTNIEASTLSYLKEIAKILDENDAKAVDDDLTRRLSDAEALALAVTPEATA